MIPGDVRDVLRILSQNGYKAYLVGGCVRDILLGLEPEDYDVATDALPETVMGVFEAEGWRVIPKGVEYGVVSVVHPKTRREIEIATFRSEYSIEPGNHRAFVVSYTTRLEEDAWRRDFTVNALYMDERGRVLDPTGQGLRDLNNRVIRFVGNPAERIREDPLRMLRAIRLAAKLGFRVHPDTMKAVRENHSYIAYVSRERIGDEILKAAKTHRFSLFARLLWESKLYTSILPEMDDMARVRHDARPPHYNETVLQHTFDVLERLDKISAPEELKLAGLLHDIGKPETMRMDASGHITFYGHEAVGARKAYKIILYSWRLQSGLARTVSEIVKLHHVPLNMALSLGRNPRDIATRLYARYTDVARLLALHAYADSGDELFLEVAREVEKLASMPQPLLNGYDIMRIYGVPPGPQVGEIKKRLYEIQLRHGITHPRELVDVACRTYNICPQGEEHREEEAGTLTVAG